MFTCKLRQMGEAIDIPIGMIRLSQAFGRLRIVVVMMS
jgi:hypothetical protein